MQMRVDRDDPVHGLRKKTADDFLADRFAFMERRILTHVAEIGRHQDEPLGAAAPQGLGGKQNRHEVVIGPVERGVENCRRRNRPDSDT